MVKDQELASSVVELLDADLPKLTAHLEHDFAKDGLPAGQFAVLGRGWQDFVVPYPDGIHVTRMGIENRYPAYSIVPRCAIKGDFDIIVSFKDFNPAPSKDTEQTKCFLIVSTDLADAAQTRTHLYRCNIRTAGEDDQRLVQASVVTEQNDRDRLNYFGTIAFEAESGRMRLARRGSRMYYLIAENDSSSFRLIGEQAVSDADVLRNGLQIKSQVFGSGFSKVVWKKLVVHADAIDRPPPR
jgi:hypothetical protein